jgi:hypothetical protein
MGQRHGEILARARYFDCLRQVTQSIITLHDYITPLRLRSAGRACKSHREG